MISSAFRIKIMSWLNSKWRWCELKLNEASVLCPFPLRVTREWCHSAMFTFCFIGVPACLACSLIPSLKKTPAQREIHPKKVTDSQLFVLWARRLGLHYWTISRSGFYYWTISTLGIIIELLVWLSRIPYIHRFWVRCECTRQTC